MQQIDLLAYRNVNEAFRRRLVYHIGKDCGFFVELNFMLDAMLWCLNHRIQFQLYSEDANFGTGTGWASVRFGVGKWLNGTINATGIYRHDKSNKFFDLPFDRTKLTAILSTTTMLRLTQRHDIRLTLNPSFQSKAIQGIYDIDPYFRLHASLRWTSDNGKWSAIIAGNNILNNHVNVYSRLANQDYSMHMWNEYPNVSLTAIYRIGGFKEKKKKEVDISRMGY